MEEQKIFLQENKSVNSVNAENHIDVEFFTKKRLLPNDNIVDNFSLYEQYNRERDECSKFRLIATINPICSNVLYNMKSEIVKDEGGDRCKTLFEGDGSFDFDSEKKNITNTSKITYAQAILDTEYSHKKIGLVYHCGVDIFDNHMLRNDGFIHINKCKDNDSDSKRLYNTIRDYLRNEEGSVIEEEIGVEYYKTGKTKLHLYNSENLLSMKEAFSSRCKEKDGWFGFVNPGNIEIPNDKKDITINRMMANNKACEFIDLYPDRSLFSFTPKFNNIRGRIEKNWDYCITYPYAKNSEKIDEICGGKNQAIRANVKKVYSNSSTEVMECSSYFKHNLKVGDYITFYYYKVNAVETETGKIGHYNTNGELLGVYDKGNEPIGGITKSVLLEYQKYDKKVKVIGVGDSNGQHKDKIFSVNFADIISIYNVLEKVGCFYKKNDHNVECNYYFRIFKKIKPQEGNEIISDINKVAFAENIYGDDISQIVFTDDIETEGLLDYNGRPITDLFLTIVKRNKGSEDFYNNKPNSDSVEYSHCFGKVTSGLDFSGIEDEPFDYNVHRLHNIVKNDNGITIANPICIENTFNVWGDAIEKQPKKLEDNITIENDEFFGDIVEFSAYNYEETVIGNVYHRFNTYQRESFKDYFMNIRHNVMVSDDYDYNGEKAAGFKIASCNLNNINSIDTEYPSVDELFFGNISPEGYYYNPHYKIKIKEIDRNLKTASSKNINYDKSEVSSVYRFAFEDGSIFIGTNMDKVGNIKDTEKEKDKIYLRIKINVPVNYGFYCGDGIAFYNKENGNTIWGRIINIDGSQLTLMFDKDAFGTLRDAQISEMIDPKSLSRIYFAFWSESNVPAYAKFAISTGKFYWRDIVPPSEITKDSEIFDTPFTNGRFYKQKNINFFLRRQDPNGKYGLSLPIFKKTGSVGTNPMLRFMVSGYDPIDFTEEYFMLDSVINTCWL